MTDELVYQIDLAWDKMGFQNLDASIAKTVQAFAVVTAAVTAASAAIFSMSKNYANATDDLIKTSERVNATTASIERLTFAAQDNGSSMDDVTSSLSSLAKAQEELLRGKGDFEAWGQLGINPTQYEDTASLLLDISDQVKGMETGRAIDLLDRVGISPNMLQTLQHGSDGLNSLGNELEALGGISTARMKKSSQDFMSGWQRATSITQGVLKKVSASMLEGTINPAIKAFNKFASDNMKQISKTITAIFEAIAKASQFIFGLVARISQPFIKLNNLLGGVEKTIQLVGAAMLVLGRSTLIAMAPAILILGALFLAFDELMSFLHGEESFMGDFFDDIGIGADNVRELLMKFGNPLDRIVQLFGLIVDGWKLIFDGISTGLDFVSDKWKSFTSWIEETIEMFKDLGKTISDALDFELPSIPSLGDVGDSVSNAAGGLYDNAKNMLGFGESKQPQAIAQTTSNNIQISVDGSQNPEATSEAIRKVLNEEMNKSASRIGY